MDFKSNTWLQWNNPEGDSHVFFAEFIEEKDGKLFIDYSGINGDEGSAECKHEDLEHARINKITSGFVIQTFTDGICVEQEFIAGDSEWEDANTDDKITKNEPSYYHEFGMRQPKKDLNVLKEQSEQMQSDLQCLLDGLDEQIVDNACQIIVDRIAILKQHFDVGE